MNQSNEKTQKPSTLTAEERYRDLPLEAISVERSGGTMPSPAADRLYQIAAVTAGLFLLATLL
jgi:hypothetical protein